VIVKEGCLGQVHLPGHFLPNQEPPSSDQQRRIQRPTPGLNSKTEDFDPSIIVLKGE
jgi:hypothetical protein